MTDELIKIPEELTEIPKFIRLYRGPNFDFCKKEVRFTQIISVDTSDEACERHGYGFKVGDVFEVPIGGPWPNLDGKKLIAVGIGLVNQLEKESIQMFFYLEGKTGISHFGMGRKTAIKYMKKIGHVDLP